MNLVWYFNRLRNMGPAEIAHRLREHTRRSASRRKHHLRVPSKSTIVAKVFPSLRERVENADPAHREAVKTAAQLILSGKYSALGQEWPKRDPGNLFFAGLWRLDPVSQRLWPSAMHYAFDIDLSPDSGFGDIKYVWEIGRLQQLPVLAAYFVLEKDEATLSVIEAAIASWFRSNPPYGGIGWASGIEVALRAISLLLVLSLVDEEISAAAKDMIATILTASHFWISRFPSLHSSANNHRVAELAGEYLIGQALGRDTTCAAHGILRESERQFHRDGSSAEQSSTYGAFSAELILFCALSSQSAGRKPGIGLDRLEVFAEFVAAIPSSLRRFGDDDEGRVVTLGTEDDYVSSVAAAICSLSGKPGPRPGRGDFRALIFGAPREVQPVQAGLMTYPDGGLTRWSGPVAGCHLELSLDHGPLGYLSIAAHGHADALAINLTVDGREIFIDPGTFLYSSGGRWRTWFRSTPAHNTLNINGESQSIVSGPFNWSNKAKARLLSASEHPFRLDAEHDGFKRRFGALHRRTISVTDHAVSIIDRLIGSAQEAEIVFQLAPGLVATIFANDVEISEKGRQVMRVAFEPGLLSVSSGGVQPGQGGFVSPRFGVKIPSPRITWRGTVDDNGVTTKLYPLTGNLELPEIIT